ncbi:MAG: hypothetical protein ACK5QT_01255 [Oligoflexia bacterium]
MTKGYALGLLIAIQVWALEPTDQPVYEVQRYYSAPQSQKIDPPILVGDVIRFQWIGEKKPDTRAAIIAPLKGAKPLSEQGWEVFSHPKDDIMSAFSMIPIKSGSLTLPELQVEDPDGKVIGRTRALQFEVAGAGGDEKPPVEFVPPLRMRFPRHWLWGGIALLGLGSVAGGYWLWRRARQLKRRPLTGALGAVTKKILEHEEALAALQKIEKQAFYKKNQHKKHYFGVSETLKVYIEKRYGIAATDFTTREMLRALDSSGLSPELIQRVSSLFEALDRVKFTDFVPAPEDDEPLRVLGDARVWIQRTRRSEVTSAT